MNEQCVVGVFESLKDAESAVKELERRNFTAQEVSLISHSVAENLTFAQESHGNRILIPGETAEYAFQRVGGEAGAVAFATNIVF